MIKYVKRKKLDVIKYDDCIEKSYQSRVYAFSWYLDIVADNWGVLVLNDYEAVMPLPWKKKYFIKYITQPYFCQQLGVFSHQKLNIREELNFIKKIPFKFLKITLSFNTENKDISDRKKLNYILNLNSPYSVLRKNFSKGRKHAIQKALKSNLELKTISLDKIIALQKSNYKYYFPDTTLQQLYTVTKAKKEGQVIGVFKEGLFIGGGFFIHHQNRIIYLFSAFNDVGRKLQASSFLLNTIIEEKSSKDFILDFEGGNMPNIGKFYRSFGAVKEECAVVKSCNINLIFKKG